MERMIVQHLHTDVSGKKPLPSDIMDGELAINYAANGETLFIKNSENAIVEFKDDKYYQKQLSEKADKTLSLTYSELVSLRDNSQLIPGQQYRITDYTCTTTQADTQSAGHVFDIIITADDESTLNEVARAVKHEGDTYFANNDLNAWQIWYCLDNDINRFEWADAINGKGVIYRMIDEFNNDIPYDFKNIQFKHPNDTTKYPYYYYTFASSNIEANTDYSLDISKNCHSNTIKEYINSGKRKLNCIIFVGQNCFCNSFGPNCYNNSSDWGYYNNIFGGGCYSNYFKDKCFNNIFGNTCFNNSFSDTTNDNYLGNKCHGNSFGSFCIGNQFGNGCSNNSVKMGFQHNSFGNGCSNNSFGSFCDYNSFGQECCCIKFASDSSATNKYDFYQNNHFGDRCKYILFRHTTAMGPNNLIQNYNFAQGLQGTSSDYLCIDGSINKEYETKVEKNSNGVIRVFCLADIVLSEYVDDITPPTPTPPIPTPPTPTPPTPTPPTPTPPTPTPPTPTLPTT